MIGPLNAVSGNFTGVANIGNQGPHRRRRSFIRRFNSKEQNGQIDSSITHILYENQHHH